MQEDGSGYRAKYNRGTQSAASLHADLSWLNQVAIWFAKIERGVTARGVLTSVTDLLRRTNEVYPSLNPARSPHPLKAHLPKAAKRALRHGGVSNAHIRICAGAISNGVEFMVPCLG